MKILQSIISGANKISIFDIISSVLTKSSRLFITILVSFVLFRIISLNAYVKYIVVNRLIESMPALEKSEALQIAFYNQIEPFLLGFANDFIVASIIAVLLYRLNRHIQIIFILLLCIFLTANIRHIFINSAHISLELVSLGLDLTFIKAEANLSFLKKLLVLMMGTFLVYGIFQVKKLKSIFVHLYLLFTIICLTISHSNAFSYPIWLSTNPFFNIKFFQLLTVDESYPSNEALLPNITHTSALRQPNLNVILIYLEGMSRNSILKADMKNVRYLAKQHIEFTNYYSRQIITANGLYSSHTGFASAFTKKYSKWDSLAPDSQETINALPRLFTNVGYHTAFLQSAPLSYMRKDEKMESLGYKEVLGDSNWSKEAAFSYNGWGIDDRSLYGNVLDYIDNLNNKDPWFVSVLTTSTHSPYNVPGNNEPSRIEALRFADVALGEFIVKLKERQLFKNTLLIITSDEGRETNDAPGMFNSLPQSQLPLVIVHPSLKSESFSQPLLNTDLPDIILRSVEAKTTKEISANLPIHQHLVFGNFITQRIFWYDINKKNISACNFDFICKKMIGVDDLSNLDHEASGSIVISMPEFEEFILKHDK